MNVKHLRQTGTSEVPATLEYGRIAISKSGKIFAGNEQNVPVEATKKAEDAIVILDKRVENTAYDIKMLQLQDILNTSEPAMICGFAEGFKNTTKQGTISKATLNTTAHRLQFDGTGSGTPTASTKTAYVAENTSNRLTQGTIYSNIVQATPASKVTQIYIAPTGEIPDGSRTTTGTIYGGYGAGTPSTVVANFTIEYLAATFEITVNIPAGSQEYDRYRIAITAPPQSGATGGMFAPVTNSNSEYVSCEWAGRVDLIQQVPTTIAADGYYQTKDIEMGAQVTGGELYLHYTALPTGATLTPTVKIGASALTAPTSVYNGRAVTIGGVSLLENKYRLPALPAGTVIGVRVDGHRVNVADVLHLYDILVAAR